MFVCRPSRPSDLEDVALLAQESPIGVTSLPPDRETLRQRIDSSVECRLDQIRAVRDSRLFTAAEVIETQGRPWLVSNRRKQEFRCCLALTEPDGDALPLSPAQILALEIRPGDSLRAVPLSAKKSSNPATPQPGSFS
jgi:arginine/ornithine N-succinyltransferase beta subunit